MMPPPQQQGVQQKLNALFGVASQPPQPFPVPQPYSPWRPKRAEETFKISWPSSTPVASERRRVRLNVDFCCTITIANRAEHIPRADSFTHTSGRDATRLSAPPTRTKRVLKATFSLFAGEHRPSPRVSPSTHVVGRPSCVASRDATQDIKTTFCVRLVSRERREQTTRHTHAPRARYHPHFETKIISLL